MQHFYFVRHGSTEWNRQRRMQGRRDSDLTAEGLEATRRLAQTLRPVRFDVCYVSPLGRARATAEALFGDRDVPICVLEELGELGFGDMEGARIEDFHGLFPEQFHDLWHDAPRYDPSAFHGESFAEARLRAAGAVEAMTAGLADASIAVVSHGMMLKFIFDHLRQRALDRFWEEPVPENSRIIQVVLDGDRRVVDFIS